MQIRTRFAPAPTGSLHLGNAHTALFSYLFARHREGEFLLRIEDTDQQRSFPAAQEVIQRELNWLGLEIDGKPLVQSEQHKKGRYTSYLGKLQKAGVLRREREAHLFVPPEEFIVLQELTGREVIFSKSKGNLRSLPIIRENGWPTYNFCCVIDDIEMGVSHVIRGDDILPQTGIQISLYNALDTKSPEFIHLPQVLGSDGLKLAKSRADLSVSYYRKEGFLPEGIVNYLALLSWSPPEESAGEIFTKEELTKLFDEKRLGLASVRFDEKKLLYLNKRHLLKLKSDPTRFLHYLKGSKSEFFTLDSAKLQRFNEVYVPRCSTFKDLEREYRRFSPQWSTKDSRLSLKEYDSQKAGKTLRAVLFRVQNENCGDLESIVREVAHEIGFELLFVAKIVRVALLGVEHSPPFKKVQMLLGEREVERRLKNAVAVLSNDLMGYLDDLQNNCEKTILRLEELLNKDAFQRIEGLVIKSEDRRTVTVTLENLKEILRTVETLRGHAI